MTSINTNISYKLCSDLESSSNSSDLKLQDHGKEMVKNTENEQSIKLDASMVIIGFVTFVGDSARGILFPALWPLCQKLGGSKVDLGYLVSIFSVGRLMVSTRMGKIADKYRHRAALLISGAVLLFGALLWANTIFLGGLPVLFIAQLTLGLGTGSLGDEM